MSRSSSRPEAPSRGLFLLTIVAVAGTAPLCLGCAPSPPGDGPETAAEPESTLTAEGQAALRAAEILLEGISSGDTSRLAEVLLPESRLVAASDDVSQPLRISDAATFRNQVANPSVDLLERMWDPVVRVDGPIATVWTPYDFHRDGEFSHCGIDAFHLVRRPDGWKVLSVIYSIHRGLDCEPSPLGEPGGTR